MYTSKSIKVDRTSISWTVGYIPRIGRLHVTSHFGDTLRSKKTLGWRTMLIVPEMDHELEVLEEAREGVCASSNSCENEETS